MTPSRRTLRTAATVVSFALLFLVLSSAAIAQTGRIVFITDRSGSWQLYTINPDGSDLFQVTDLAPTDDDAWFPSISPDGKRIAFNYNTGNGPDLYVVNADGSGLQQLTNDHNSLWPRWSPDGRKLVFTTASDLGTGVIATIAADGSGPRRVLTSDKWESAGGFYTPDGKQIVFGSEIDMARPPSSGE